VWLDRPGDVGFGGKLLAKLFSFCALSGLCQNAGQFEMVVVEGREEYIWMGIRQGWYRVSGWGDIWVMFPHWSSVIWF